MNSEFEVYISIGSNIGNRASNIQSALARLKEYGHIVKTSFLYESKPMYYTDQASFLNAACLIRTRLSPGQLLSALKCIEQEIGRTTTFRNGPRIIDLDIVLYADHYVNSSDLIIPHPRCHERCFVLRPLLDIDPNLKLVGSNEPLSEILSRLEQSEKLSGTFSELRRTIPLGFTQNGAERLVFPDERTLIAGILNATPDRLEMMYLAPSMC